jgi:hypothetical protein
VAAIGRKLRIARFCQNPCYWRPSRLKNSLSERSWFLGHFRELRARKTQWARNPPEQDGEASAHAVARARRLNGKEGTSCGQNVLDARSRNRRPKRFHAGSFAPDSICTRKPSREFGVGTPGVDAAIKFSPSAPVAPSPSPSRNQKKLFWSATRFPPTSSFNPSAEITRV